MFRSNLLIAAALMTACRSASTEKEDPFANIDQDEDGYTPSSGDCDDTNATVYPGADEVCDDIDNNCNEVIDEDPIDGLMYYPDLDGDGYGVDEGSEISCTPIEGSAELTGDCDDAEPARNPGATDIPNDGIDQDCDGEDLDLTLLEDAQVGDLLISEIMHDPAAVEDYKGEWFEIHNPTEKAILIQGLVVSGGEEPAFVVQEELVALPNGYLVFAVREGGTQNGGLERVDYVYERDALRLDNMGTIKLQNSDGVVYDEVSYNVNDGFPSAVGASLNLGLIDADSNDLGTSWCESSTAYGDGDLGTPGASNDPCDVDEDGYAMGEDCDDYDAATNPSASEICDEKDNDCNGVVDEGVTDTFYSDLDGDGYGDVSSPQQSCEVDVGLSENSLDCNDDDAAINPDAEDLCDDIDNNCDGQIDEGAALTFYADADGDGFGSALYTAQGCSAPAGYVEDNTDCNDLVAAVNPSAQEICDTLDNDCDGDTDDADASIDYSQGGINAYVDSDLDGYGDASSSAMVCEVLTGYSSNGDDCNDSDAAINPMTNWHQDSDTDGYGAVNAVLIGCQQPNGYVLDGSDCNDASQLINPGMPEICDSLDNDCDALTDDDDPSVDLSQGGSDFYIDVDGDGYGTPIFTVFACAAPTGYAATSDDCDDTDTEIHPMASEQCDSIDNNCNGIVDENVQSTWFADTDSDGYGDSAQLLLDCNPPSGYVDNADDCNDGDSSVNPAADEICDNIDNDCDGNTDDADSTIVGGVSFYADADGDLFGDSSDMVLACEAPESYVSDSTDCDDANYNVHPDEVEGCDDGIDQNCDGDLGSNHCDYRLISLGQNGVKIGNQNTPAAFGYTTSPIGDLNSDGIPDIAIGARFADEGGGLYSGATYIFFGTINSTQQSSNADAILYGAEDDRSSMSISGGTPLYGGISGDINGDNHDDLLINAMKNDVGGADAGAVYLVNGPVSGMVDLSTSATATLTGESPGDELGRGAVSILGDVNQDGLSDIFIGSYKHANEDGAAYLILGGSIIDGNVASMADVALYGGLDQGLGYAVAGPGDVNGDGFNDALVSAYRADGVDQDSGAMLANTGMTYLFYGESGTPSWDMTAPDASFMGEGADDKTGYVLSGAGDVDSDGLQDILIGAPLANVGGDQDGGAAYLVSGGTNGLVHLNAATAKFIREDILSTTDGTQFGRSVSGIGDVDGDGFDDIIVGAKKSDRGGLDSGAAYIYYGPLSGVYTAPHGVIAGEMAGDEAGISVSGVGDIDGNGSPDILIGANKNSGSLTGSAYLFWGEGL